MAKAKQQELSIDEKLEQALVPEDEQPYEVPSNWIWTSLGNLIETSKEKCEDFSGLEQKYVGLEHMKKDSGIIGYDSSKGIKSLKNVFYSGEILYGKLRPYLNKHDIASFDGVCSTDILVFRHIPITFAQYVNYYFDTDKFIEYAVSNSKGINLPRVSESTILDAIIPLPPLAEQQRIVDRIESLFEKLDNAKEMAQNALDTFETCKAAILHKAFTGELTEKWREKNGVGMDSWKEKPLASIANIVSGYAFASQDFDVSHEIPCVKITNVGVGTYLVDDTDVCLPMSYLKEYERFIVNEQDILISLTRSFINSGLKVCIYPESRKALLNQRVALLRSENIKYLFYYLRTDEVLNYVKIKSKTTNQPNLSIKDLEKLIVPVPSLLEQQEIARILDNLFEKEEKAKELCDVIEKIDLMKKAILARAFRGELGTNDPNEESSVELLKECLR